jgi:sugar phosphate isomerase/epimerase
MSSLSRRSFLALSASLPWAFAVSSDKKIPIGLELYSVREELKKDLDGTVRGVAKLGYECVEFYAPYFDWTEAQAKQMRRLLDHLGVRCFSTHNDQSYFGANQISHMRELNSILGAKYV